MRTIHTDCLVLGAGLAGSAYALHAARAGLKVELLSLGEPLQANSDWAQGGIIYDTSADPAQLARDILEASDGTANPAAIDQLVREGPPAVKDLLLDELHVGFDRDAKGELHFTREGGHAERRIIHTKDATGHAILAAIKARVDATAGITRRAGFVAVDLLTLSHNSVAASDRYEPLTCFGCYALDTATDEVVAFVARKTILATGGLGGIFQHTTNQPGSVGHGDNLADSREERGLAGAASDDARERLAAERAERRDRAVEAQLRPQGAADVGRDARFGDQLQHLGQRGKARCDAPVRLSQDPLPRGGALVVARRAHRARLAGAGDVSMS